MSINGKGRPTAAQKAESAKVQKYTQAIAAYEREFKKWETRSDKIIRRYRDDRVEAVNNRARFNILWSNVQTLVPATFSRLPQPDVSRRFKDNDPVGRVASMILERGMEFEIEHYPDYRATLKQSVQDRFLGGRGTAWVRYEPHLSAIKQDLPEDGDQVTEDADEPDEQLDYECAPIDYVHWKDFGHSIARTWEEVTKVWRRVYMTRAACVERFGDELGNQIPVDTSPDDKNKDTAAESSDYLRALVHEIWDKETKEAVWLSKSMGKILDCKADPLKLEGFFPCPKPLYATLTNETLIPVPDFTLYQDQAIELDTLADRIDGLVKALQVKGVYDAATPELGRLFTEGTNTDLIPVKNFAAFAEKMGLKGSIDLVDLTPIANALKVAYEAMEQIKQQVYEINGVADIVRGQSDPRETLGAQKLKGQFASLRLKDYQNQVAVYATECLRLKAQIMCGKFEPQTLMKMAGVDQFSEADKPLVPAAMQLLMGDRAINPDADMKNPVRDFRIEIAANTLVEMDEEAEKQGRMEFLQAVGTYFEKALPMVQAAPEAGPIVVDLLKFGITAFKVGKQIEGSLDEALDKLKQSAAQPKQPPVDPAMEKVKAQAAAENQKQQNEVMLERQRLQMEQQAEQQRMAHEAAIERQRNMMEDARAQQQAMWDAAMEKMKMIYEGRIELEKAEISAKTTLDAAQITAAKEGTVQ